jgi:hypothetical protein
VEAGTNHEVKASSDLRTKKSGGVHETALPDPRRRPLVRRERRVSSLFCAFAAQDMGGEPLLIAAVRERMAPARLCVPVGLAQVTICCLLLSTVFPFSVISFLIFSLKKFQILKNVRI